MNNAHGIETWGLLRQGPLGAAWNMALDEVLLKSGRRYGQPLLRFYAWAEPAATFGYSQRYDLVASWTTLRPLVRRPTGGGLVPHDRDFTYSLVFPPGHAWHQLRARDSYQRAHEWVCTGLRRLGRIAALAPVAVAGMAGRCFAGAEQHDVLCDGAKVAGAAQRRTRDGLLIQGSVQFGGGNPERIAIEEALLAAAATEWGIAWAGYEPAEDVQEQAAKLATEKYGCRAWNETRENLRLPEHVPTGLCVRPSRPSSP
jgi:lipoate-protein ligase A